MKSHMQKGHWGKQPWPACTEPCPNVPQEGHSLGSVPCPQLRQVPAASASSSWRDHLTVLTAGQGTMNPTEKQNLNSWECCWSLISGLAMTSSGRFASRTRKCWEAHEGEKVGNHSRWVVLGSARSLPGAGSEVTEPQRCFQHTHTATGPGEQPRAAA